MLVTVMITATPPGRFTATVPDLPGCVLTDGDQGSLLARTRLAIEGRLIDALLAGEELPVARDPADWRADGRFAGARALQVHMNLAHLRAVARHQRRGGPGPAGA